MLFRVPTALCVLGFVTCGVACGGDLGSDRDGAPTDRDAGPPAGRADAGQDAGPADAGPTCPGRATTSDALRFDGIDDYVGMGVAPELGLAELTLEAWVYREGAGVTTGTGAGGITILPIVAKGRGERDGSNVDCNYAFGIQGDVLAADFEDMASGANHPVLGRTPIPQREWHHVAVSYDGTTWRLFVDGTLDVEQDANATPRADSIQHFGIGTTFNSSGVPAGHFAGLVDEVRVFDHARGEADIRATMYDALESAEGMVGRWSLDEADGGADATGTNPGTIEGATFLEGAPLGGMELPSIAVASPLDEAEVGGASVDLSVDVGDGAPIAVTLHARELTAEDDFTIVVLPDSQYYTVESRALHGYFYDQTRWVVENQDAYNIVGLIHNGDIVNNADVYYQWMVADRAMGTLETPSPGFFDGVPYGVAVGNHDQFPRGETGSTSEFNEFFGVGRFRGRIYYGGHYPGGNEQSWVTFQAGGVQVVVVSLEFDDEQDPAVLEWARGVFQTYPDALGILNSHYIVTGGGNFSAQGRAIYEGLKDVPNLHLMTSGHVTAEQHRIDTFEGHTIHSMVADYQSRDDGGSGYMRIWEFSPANDELTVRTYSPRLDTWETDENSEFTIPLDLSSTTSTGLRFDEVGRIEHASGVVSATLDELTPGGVYEWYAEIDDCRQRVRTPVARFRVSP